MASKKGQKGQGLTASTADWADFGFDDIFAGSTESQSTSSSPSTSSGASHSPPHFNRDSSNASTKSDDGKKKGRKEKVCC